MPIHAHTFVSATKSRACVVVFIASLPFGKHIHIYYVLLTDYITSYPWTTLHIYIYTHDGL